MLSVKNRDMRSFDTIKISRFIVLSSLRNKKNGVFFVILEMIFPLMLFAFAMRRGLRESWRADFASPFPGRSSGIWHQKAGKRGRARKNGSDGRKSGDHGNGTRPGEGRRFRRFSGDFSFFPGITFAFGVLPEYNKCERIHSYACLNSDLLLLSVNPDFRSTRRHGEDPVQDVRRAGRTAGRRHGGRMPVLRLDFLLMSS